MALRALVVLSLLGLGLVPAEPPSGPAAAAAEGFRGTIRNDEEPFLIRADHGPLYRCRWNGGSTLWSLGDRVRVTGTAGPASMVKLGSDASAQVWVEEIAW